ncbi:MAG: efflux RND transporter periplasmic adaptor subunit [Armatimonadetes bacterium]|nr:efflux RND transporter periplasmic adaptor subunit [Armatimonadota bacterium]
MKTWLIVLGLIIIVALVGFQCVRMRAQFAAAANRPLTATVEKGDVTVEVVESGFIEPVQKIEVKSRVSGRISELYVEEGDRVTKGDLLAIIDPQELKLQLEQTSAQLRSAESSVARSAESLLLTGDQVRTALEQATARFIRAKREWEAQPELTRAATEQARLSHDTAVRNRDLLLNTTHPQESVRLETDLQRARVTYDNDKRNYERMVSLLEQGFVPKRQMDDARTQMDLSASALTRADDEHNRMAARHETEAANAEEQVRQAKAGLDQALARAEVDKNKEQTYLEAKSALDQAQADMRRVEIDRRSHEQAQAQADQIRSAVADGLRKLGETEIRAPRDGVITRRMVEEGELVTALSSFSGGTPIVELADLSGLQVRLEVNEIDVAELRVDMAAEIEVDAFPEEELTGRITKIAPASQPAAGGQGAVVKYEVEVLLDNPNARIKPGMSAKCTMRVTDRTDVLRLPIEFVGKDDEGRFVMLAPPKGKPGKKAKPERRAIEVGETSASHIELISGVEEGDEVVKPEFTGPKRRGAMQFGDED